MKIFNKNGHKIIILLVGLLLIAIFYTSIYKEGFQFSIGSIANTQTQAQNIVKANIAAAAAAAAAKTTTPVKPTTPVKISCPKPNSPIPERSIPGFGGSSTSSRGCTNYVWNTTSCV